MRGHIKEYLATTSLYTWSQQGRQEWAYRAWLHNDRRGLTPHKRKQQLVRMIAQRHNLRVLVETGTYRGDMVQAMKGYFIHVYTIELSAKLCARAQRRFRKDSNVTVIHGDSAKRLADVTTNLDRPALFWLDGHYSGGMTAQGVTATPILDELAIVLPHLAGHHGVLVDDARLFGMDAGYPTLNELKEHVAYYRPEVEVTVVDDILSILPRPSV